MAEAVFRRDLPPAGVYGCVRTSGFVPWLIRMLARNWCDHVFVSIGDGQIIEAEPGGVRVRFGRARRSVMCSQLTAQAGSYAGLDWNCGQDDPACVTPAMLAARLDDTSWA